MQKPSNEEQLNGIMHMLRHTCIMTYAGIIVLIFHEILQINRTVKYK